MELHHWLGLASTALIGAVGVVIWLIRLEGRVNLLQQMHHDCGNRCDERNAHLAATVDGIDRDLNASTTSLFSLVGDLDRIVHRLEGIIDSTRRP